jgi:hypothetical protein
MIFVLLASLVACHQDFAHTVELTDSAPLSDLDTTCAPSDDRATQGDTEVFSRVGPGDADGTAACAASVVAAGPLLLWADIDEQLDSYGAELDSWTAARAAIRSLQVSSADGQIAPPGSIVRAEQILVTEDQRDDVLGAADPFAAADALLADADGQVLLSVEYRVTGDEDDLAPELDPARTALGSTGVLSRSWQSDTALQLVTVASVAVPEEALANVPLIGLTLDLDEQVTIEGEVCVGMCDGFPL